MKVKLTIGDWSEDGHSHYEEFVFEANKSLKEIQDAYKMSCRKLGLIFDCNSNHTGIKGLDWQHPEYSARQVFVEYEQNKLSNLASKILTDNGFVLKKYYSGEDFCQFMIQFIQLSLPDLVMEEAAFKKSELKTIPAINGWWGDLNEGWGYGLYID